MSEYMDMQMDKALTDVRNQMDLVAKEGLKRKGFIFKNEIEFMHFVVNRCRAIKNNNITTYFVDNKPFLQYIENPEPTKIEGNKISVIYGRYLFL